MIGLCALGLAACGGGSNDSADGDAGSGDVVVEQVSADAPAGDLSAVVTAIEATGYDCSPESFVMTTAVRETCITTSSIALSAYAWGTADDMAAQIDGEIYCTKDSGMDEITSLRGDTWAISAVSLSGSISPEAQTRIDDTLATLADSLGGTVSSADCR
jgi:hypothetical protein